MDMRPKVTVPSDDEIRAVWNRTQDAIATVRAFDGMQPAPASVLTEEEREHLPQAIDMLGNYEAEERKLGDEAEASRAGSVRAVLVKLFRFLPRRTAGVVVGGGQPI